MNTIPRPEHPRPDFFREQYLNLNGVWQFAFDDEDFGLSEEWFRPEKTFPLEITVPFAYQTKMSGLGPNDEIHPILWYRRSFSIPETMKGRRILLHFGAVDYASSVYVNGNRVGEHKGGYTPFTLDVTPYLKEASNDLCVRVEDWPDVTQPRGKQYWDRGVMGCWYTPVSGIWQTVYMEAVGVYAIRQIHISPDIDRGIASAEIALDKMPAKELTLSFELSFRGRTIKTQKVSMNDRHTRVPIDVTEKGGLTAFLPWTPERPNLYDLKVTLQDENETLDSVNTYFGMRSIEVREGCVYLNHSPLYQRLILDQGYWPDSNLTPPSDDAIRLDVELTKRFGYNGARKHQKIEDPRYYYWADKLGLLVWGELPSAYDFTDETIRNWTQTLGEFIDRDFNHPSIITWTPINESWGVRQIFNHPRQQETARLLYHLTKALDGTRLVSSNDGWEQTESDYCALHDYADTGEMINEHFEDRGYVEAHGCTGKAAYVKDYWPDETLPFLITEYGGIAFTNIGLQGDVGGMQTWGYHEKVTDEEAFFARFEAVTDAIRAIPYCQGYCYTQLTDVMQEINGVLTPDRQPKMDPVRFASINRNPDGR